MAVVLPLTETSNRAKRERRTPAKPCKDALSSESNSLFENWIIVCKLGIARNLVFEGLSIEQAAAAPEVQLSVEEVRDYMAKRPLPPNEVRRFPW